MGSSKDKEKKRDAGGQDWRPANRKPVDGGLILPLRGPPPPFSPVGAAVGKTPPEYHYSCLSLGSLHACGELHEAEGSHANLISPTIVSPFSCPTSSVGEAG